jgi:dolichyl-phosphate-mannose--protein O-mannosyl transferase
MKKDNIILNLILFFSALATSLGIFMRLMHLSFPKEKVFDEVYFPVFAQDYLTRTTFFDVHPPFGKFLIAIGIKLFGFDEFGWRIIPAICGILVVLGLGYIWYKWQKDWLGGVILAGFAALDGLLITYSRTSLIDEVGLFVILLAFLAAVLVKKRSHLIWLAILIGLAVSVKWLALGIIAPVAFIMWRKKLLKWFLLSLVIACAIYILNIYLGQVIIRSSDPIQKIFTWHKESMQFHLNLKDGHPWSSKWWSWPIFLRPVLFYYKDLVNGKIAVITSLPNPLLGWLSAASIILSAWYLAVLKLLYRQKIADHPLTIILIGFFAFWLPWAFAKRVFFIYHYLPSYSFALMSLTYWVSVAYKKYNWIALILVLGIFACGIYFIPFSVGTGLSSVWLSRHVWINSWLY